ncbi:MAG: hypothetical protein ABIG95_01285 [Candidatus Woesearchaeota archaeon]
MFDKKGEKSLQMIFGLFILLIISLVVLSLFFKFTEKSSGTMTETQETFFSEAKKQDAISDCENLCNKITNVNNALEFCKATKMIDFDSDKMASKATQADWGEWSFCEDRIPCFILTDCKSGITTYDGSKCKEVMTEKRMQFYKALEYDSTEVTGDVKGGTCKMDVSGEPQSSPNWVYRYGYYEGAP